MSEFVKDSTEIISDVPMPKIVKRVNHVSDGFPHYEILQCGHQNNLRLPDRESGVCPKGCKL